jgi:NAD(P)-dependent dehydrogenase (short-subunit alcohol dehydrogenase family)
MSTSTSRHTAIVTGAAGGVGKATAERLVADGATVIAVDRDQDRLEVTAKELGPSVCPLRADVAIAHDWDRVLAVALEETGRLDLLVNNAGIEGPITSLVGYPEEDFRRVLDINVVGVFLGMKTCAAALGASGRGSIVNVASVSGLGGQPSIMGYVASKHAVIGMTKAAALELAGSGVRVNAVCPSPVETDMIHRLANTLSPEDPELVHRRMREAAPLGRYATAAEVAAAIAFLASDDAAYLTGVALPVDGGSRAR